METSLRACSHEARYLGGQGYLGLPRYLAWTTRVTQLTGTTIIHVNTLQRDISGGGGGDNFVSNAHDQYSHMEDNMAEIADATCEHAQYTRRNPFNFYRTATKRENIEKIDKTKFLSNTNFYV